MVRKQRPPLQEYLRKLLYRDLNRANTEKVYNLKVDYFVSMCVVDFFEDIETSKEVSMD